MRAARYVYRFQFTHPGRGATIVYETHIKGSVVSIHAPREGCDQRTISEMEH